MVTSLDRRNFVSVACTATKNKLGPFSFLNFPFMYLKTVEKQKRKKKIFPPPPPPPQSWHTYG